MIDEILSKKKYVLNHLLLFFCITVFNHIRTFFSNEIEKKNEQILKAKNELDTAKIDKENTKNNLIDALTVIIENLKKE